MCLKTTSIRKIDRVRERERERESGEERDRKERGIEEAIEGGRRQCKNIKTSID